jgi:pentatricopeptide repeat protein
MSSFSGQHPSGMWTVSWNLVIAHIIKYTKQYYHATKLFRSMKGFIYRKSSYCIKFIERGVKPNIITYSLMIRCYAGMGDRDQLENVFSEAQKTKINKPLIHTYMRAAIQFKDQSLFETIWKDYFPLYKLEPDEQSYCIYLDGSKEFGKLEESWQLITNTPYKDHFMVNYNYIRYLLGK